MRIAYLLESGELSGGVRVVLEQARALRQRGHETQVFIRRSWPDWYHHACPCQAATDFAKALATFAPDVVIATFWTTIADAIRQPAALAVHLCQGIEFEFSEYALIAAQIYNSYRAIRHKLVIGPWLTVRLQQHFPRQSLAVAEIGQCVDLDLYRPSWLEDLRATLTPLPRLLLPGVNTAVKGVPIALAAIRRLRQKGLHFRLIRVSPSPIDRAAEGLAENDETFVAAPPAKMAELYRRASVVITPSQPAEGFGLPFAEALACRRPVVATAIPSYLSLAEKKDYAFFAPANDVAALAEAIEHALTNRWLAWRYAVRGARHVQRFSAHATAARIEQALMQWLKERA